MRIKIKGEGRNVDICLPTALIFNGITAEVAAYSMGKSAPARDNNLSARQMRALFSEFRRIKNKYGTWTLVDVQSSDGETVKIIL